MGTHATIVNNAYAAFGRGDIAAVLPADGTHTTGERQSYGAAHAFTIRGGKITHFREYVDVDKTI